MNENKTKIIIWRVIPDVRKQTTYETPRKLKEISSTPLDRMHYKRNGENTFKGGKI